MIVLVGEFSTGLTRCMELLHLGFGRMWSSKTPSILDGEPSGFDNGAYSLWKIHCNRQRPLHWREFDDHTFSKRLEKALGIIQPIVAVCPDLPMAGEDSLGFSVWWRRKLPDTWPWFLAIQDNMTTEKVIANLESFDGLFLGGSDKCKIQAKMWCDLAHRYGKRFHYGRASTPGRIRDAISIRADSLDSSIPVLKLSHGDKAGFHRWLNAFNQCQTCFEFFK